MEDLRPFDDLSDQLYTELGDPRQFLSGVNVG